MSKGTLGQADEIQALLAMVSALIASDDWNFEHDDIEVRNCYYYEFEADGDLGGYQVIGDLSN